MATYDASVIEQFADALYVQAKYIVIRYALIGGVAGFLIGYAIAGSARSGDASVVGAVVAFFGLILGVMQGRAKAFALKLMAQQALCQVQTEKNTRTAGTGTRAA